MLTINGEPWWYYLAIPGFLGLGLFFLRLFAGWIIAHPTPESEYEKLEPVISQAQLRRLGPRLAILEQIGGPECRDGTFSPRQIKLWQEYNALRRHDDILTDKERRLLAKARR